MQGEPICMNEYGTRIARGKNTHVLQIVDYQGKVQNLFKTKLIAPNSNFHELVLK